MLFCLSGSIHVKIVTTPVHVTTRQFIILTQDLLHRGDGYNCVNICPHMYFDNGRIPKEDYVSTTFPEAAVSSWIAVTSCRRLRRMIALPRLLLLHKGMFLITIECSHWPRRCHFKLLRQMHRGLLGLASGVGTSSRITGSLPGACQLASDGPLMALGNSNVPS